MKRISELLVARPPRVERWKVVNFCTWFADVFTPAMTAHARFDSEFFLPWLHRNVFRANISMPGTLSTASARPVRTLTETTLSSHAKSDQRPAAAAASVLPQSIMRDHDELSEDLDRLATVCRGVVAAGGHAPRDVAALKRELPVFAEDYCAHLRDKEVHLPNLVRMHCSYETHTALVMRALDELGPSACRLYLPPIWKAATSWASPGVQEVFLALLPDHALTRVRTEWLAAHDGPHRSLLISPSLDSNPL